MEKIYSNEEIDGLIQEVQDQFMTPLFKAAQEELLAKAESGKQMPSPKEGGNGTTPAAASMKSDGGGPRSAAMLKEESPIAKEAGDEGPPKKDASSASPSISDSPAAEDSSASPPPAADPAAASPDASAPPDASADPAMAGQDPAMAGQDQTAQLAEAYGALSDEDLKGHYEAIKGVIMQRMQAQGGAAGGMDPAASGAGPVPPTPSLDAGAPAGGPPPAGPAAAGAGAPPPPVADPAQKAAPAMGMPPKAPAPVMPAMKSEVAGKEEVLVKAEVETLQAQVAGLTSLLESMLTPTRKSVTSMADYLAKNESEKPVAKKMNKTEVKAKLARLAATPDLAKNDREVINRYFLDGADSVKLEEIEHLLK